MNDYLAALILLLLAIGGVVVRKTYYYLPPRELKRRAEHDDALAARLYPAVAYGESLRVLLWVWIGVTTAGGFVLLAHVAPILLSFIAVVLLIWVIQSWIPASRVTSLGASLTNAVTPAIIWLLNYLHPSASRAARVIQPRYNAPLHTGLFERSDLIELIEQQQHQHDSRFTDEELEIARRALNFSEYKVSDALIPRKATKIIVAKDTVGPVLIDELHKNGQAYVLVRETAKGDFVGTLAFKNLNLHSSGLVKDFMHPGVAFIHENDSLNQALHAFFTTRQPLLVVVNGFEEYVGMLTIDGVLKQLLGHIPGDDFDSYHDQSAVISRHLQKTKPPETAHEETAKQPAKPEKGEQKLDEKTDKPEKKAEEPAKTETEVVE